MARRRSSNPYADERWRRLQEQVPIPPSPTARIVVPEPRPEPAEPMEDTWYDEAVDTEVDTPFITLHDSIEVLVPEREGVRTATGFTHQQRMIDLYQQRVIRQQAEWLGQVRGLRQAVGLRQEPTREVTVEFDESTNRVQSRAVERPHGYWKLRNGKFIEISQMDNEHLENCIRLCERNSQARGRRADSNAQGAYGELVRERERRVSMVAQAEYARRQMLAHQNNQELMSRRAQARFIPNSVQEVNVGQMDTQPATPLMGFGGIGGIGVWPTSPDSVIGLDRTAPTAAQEPEGPQQVPGAIPEGAPKRRIKI